jgi:hypothetical protein
MIDGFCGPVMPGWTSARSQEGIQAEAPYLVPMVLKPIVFRTVCGTDRTRTVLKLTPQKSGQYNFELLDADSEKKVSLIKQKRLKAVREYSNNIETTHVSERFHPLWSLRHHIE